MSFRLTAPIHRLGQPTENHTVGEWKSDWSKSANGQVQKLSAVAGELWRFFDQHTERAKARLSEKASGGSGRDWRERMGLPGDTLRKDVERVRQALQAAARAGNEASDLMADALKTRENLCPFDPSDTSAAGAVTRASIRQRLATMPKDQRAAYLKRDNLSNEAVRAILEVDPEMSGFDSSSITFCAFADSAMQQRHGPTLRNIDEVNGAATYVLNLAAAMESACKAEALDFGLRVDEVSDFVSDALAA